MCGIFGSVSAGRVTPEHLERIRLMGDVLAHRGPDSEGLWHDEEIILGHRRLSILDLTETGNQPMHCIAGRYSIVFNGEIYNFLELRRQLGNKGYSFKTDTDTEVIAAAYDAWGSECLHRFNGMWAFALWDSLNRTLFLARDRFGVKPLYYTRAGADLVFASEVKALHCWLGRAASLDTEVLTDISQGSRSYHGTERTYLKQVSSLPAGHMAVVQSRKMQIELQLKQWYKLSRIDVPKSFLEQAGLFRELFIDACRLRLRSDVPIATCLSGGLDSSSIVSVLYRVLGHENIERAPVDFHSAFCAGFADTMIDEADLAKSCMDELQGELKVINLALPDPERLEKAMRACDGPMPNLAFYPISELYGFIHQHGFKVTIDGQGSDEMLGGYFPLSDALITALNTGDLFWAGDVYRTYRSQGEFRYYSARSAARVELFSALKKTFLPSFSYLNKITSRSTSTALAYRTTLKNYYVSQIPESFDPFQQNLYKAFFQNTLPMLLSQYDRCSMAHSVECRMPFMDYRLVELIFSLPNSSRVGGGYTKRILREAMKGILSEKIRTRKTKLGFHPPQVDWFCGPLKEWMLDIMNIKSFVGSSFFDGRKLRDELEDLLCGCEDKQKWNLAGKFWGPIHVAWWLENHNHIAKP